MSEYQDILDSPSTPEHKGYAGFLLRFVAYIIDSLILSIPIYGTMFALFGTSMMSGDPATVEEAGSMFFIWYLLILAIMWFYYAYMESSSNQATIGKMALGLKVTDMNGNKLNFMQASGRFFGKILSSLIVGIGYLMIAFTEKKQGLHDILAKTLVVKK